MNADLRGSLLALAMLLLPASAPPQSPPQHFDLSLALRPGDRLIEHRYLTDRIEWKLPRKRLAPFVRSGVIIHEERHTTAVVHAHVIRIVDDMATLGGDVRLVTFDVPRHQTTQTSQTFTARLNARNVAPNEVAIDVEDAAMAGLPVEPVRIGECWGSQRAVMTELGSGRARFVHCADTLDGSLLRISVRGAGTITGSEYHLPKLLPGSIKLEGAAWYDLAAHLITQESYRIHDRLLKPAEHEQIGFDQILDVDSSTRRQ